MSAPKKLKGRGPRRDKVLDEAAKALNREGISLTSLAAAAKRVGISRAALYYYFEDQQDLVFQCYLRSCDQLARRLNEAIDGAANSLEVIDQFIAGMLSEGEPEFAALSESAFLREEQRRTILGRYEAVRASLAHVLDEGARRGELRACHAELIASAMIGLISWIPTARRWQWANRPSDQDLIEPIRALFRDGIAADRSKPARYVPISLLPMTLPAVQVFDPAAMAAARQEALLVAASWLFNLKGVDATPLDEIAQRVGVTKKVIYHNLGDKQALVAQCYRRAFHLYEYIGARMRAYDGTRIDALTASAHALAEASLREDIAPFRPFTGFEARPQPERDEIQAAAERLSATYMEAFSQGKAEGSIGEVDAAAILELLPGLFEWLPKWFDLFTEEARARAPRELAEFFQLGMRPLSSPTRNDER